jgi:hypothetical protein
MGESSESLFTNVPAAFHLKVFTVAGGPPPATDCDQVSEDGRIAVRTDGPPNAYACTGTACVPF